ncbi:MAG: CBS domain-containing protein [Anaerolineales bacterium]|nr:CBS domain-containing protein [Anaerolineales bacterium]
MKDTFVREWMTPDPVTVSSLTTLPEAHKLMAQRKIRRLLVVDDGRLVGIITRGDVRGAEPSGATTLSIYELNYLLAKLTIGAIMTRHPVTVGPDTPIREAARLMLEHKIAGLPVVADGRVVGIITESDIFRLVAKTWGAEEDRN